MSITTIEFIGEGGHIDGAQFDTTDTKELIELWLDFCDENGFNPHNIIEIYEERKD